MNVHALKARLCAMHGWDIYRQQVVDSSGSVMRDEDAVMSPPEGLPPLELLIVLGPGYPAVIALGNVCFTRTAREHAGRPIYHGHTQLGAPCQVVWSSDGGWMFVQLTQVSRCGYDSLPGTLGFSNDLADIGDAVILRVDAVSASRPNSSCLTCCESASLNLRA